MSIESFLVEVAIAAIKEYVRERPRCREVYDRDGHPEGYTTKEKERETRKTRHVGHGGHGGEPPEVITIGEERFRDVTILHAMMNCGGDAKFRRIGPIEWGTWGPWRKFEGP